MTKTRIKFDVHMQHLKKQFHKNGMQLMKFDLFTIAKATSLLPVFGIFEFHSTAICIKSSLLQCIAFRAN